VYFLLYFGNSLGICVLGVIRGAQRRGRGGSVWQASSRESRVGRAVGGMV